MRSSCDECGNSVKTFQNRLQYTGCDSWYHSKCQGMTEPRIQNSDNDLFNPNITFYIFLNKYIKLIISFGLGRHLLRHDIMAGTDATLGSFNIHIR